MRASRWNRILWAVTAATALAYVAGVVYVVDRLTEARSLIEHTYRTGTWAAVQLEQEYDRLVNASLSADLDPSPAHYATLRERYDIFWSRIDILQSGKETEGIRLIPGVEPLLAQLRVTLGKLDEMLGLDSDGVSLKQGSSQAIRDMLAPSEVGIRDIVRRSLIQDQYVYNRSALNQTTAEMVILLAVLFVLGLGLILLALTQLRRAGLLYREASIAKDDVQRLSLAIAASNDGIALTDAAGRLTSINQAYLTMFGLESSAQALRRAWTNFYPASEQHRLENEAWPVLVHDQRWNGQVTSVDRQGNRVCQDLSIARLDDGGMLHISRDITRQRADAEARRRLEEQLLVAQKMEAIAHLASGFAHDFNNVLASIQGYAEIILDEVAPDQPTHHFIGQVLTGVKRGRELVDRIMGFARPGGEDGEETADLAAVVEEASGLLVGALPKNVTLAVGDMPSGIKVGLPAEQLMQILMNLGVNARDALGAAGGRISFRVDDADLGAEPPVRLGARLPDKDYIRLAVEDDGCGIAESDLIRIFEPLFTTKPRGTGTGLGLSVVHGIVSGCGGEIAVWSKAGAGTRFVLYLPLAAGQGRRTSAGGMAPDRPLHILLVDDDALLAEAAAEALVRAGHQVAKAPDAATALALIENTIEPLDAIVTDEAMPGMHGSEFIRTLRERGNMTPIILWSANADRRALEVAGVVGTATHVDFCRKPVSTADLLSALGRATAARPRHGIRTGGTQAALA